MPSLLDLLLPDPASSRQVLLLLISPRQAPAKAGAILSPTSIPNNRKPPILDGDGDGRINGESRLFQPGTFKKKKRDNRIAATRLALQGVIPVAFADF